MNNSDRYYLIQSLINDLNDVTRIERNHCTTHSQRNAANQLIRVLAEKLDDEFRLLKAAPNDEKDDIHAIPF